MNTNRDIIASSHPLRRWRWLVVLVIASAFIATTVLVLRAASAPEPVAITESCEPAYLRQMDQLGTVALPAFSTNLDAITTQIAPADGAAAGTGNCAVTGGS